MPLAPAQHPWDSRRVRYSQHGFGVAGKLEILFMTEVVPTKIVHLDPSWMHFMDLDGFGCIWMNLDAFNALGIATFG